MGCGSRLSYPAASGARSRALTPAAMRTDSHKLASHSQRTHSQLHAGPRLHRHRHQAATHRCRAESDEAERTQLQPVDKIVSVKLFFDDDGKPSAHYLARWKVWPVWHCLQLLSVPLWLRCAVSTRCTACMAFICVMFCSQGPWTGCSGCLTGAAAHCIDAHDGGLCQFASANARLRLQR